MALSDTFNGTASGPPGAAVLSFKVANDAGDPELLPTPEEVADGIAQVFYDKGFNWVQFWGIESENVQVYPEPEPEQGA